MKKMYRLFLLVTIGTIMVACSRDSEDHQVKVGKSSEKRVMTTSSQADSLAEQSSVPEEASSGSSGPAGDAEKEGVLEQEEVAEKQDVIEETQPSVSHHQVLLSVRPQIQEVWYYCAPTTVSMILSSRGVDVDQYQLAKEMGTYEPFGTHNRDAVRILNKHLFGYEAPEAGQAGYRLERISNVGPEELHLFKQRIRQNIQDGYPMYYTMDMSKVYPGMSGEHNVAGIGYELTPDGQDIAYLYYLDPYPKVQDAIHGGLKKITPQALLESLLTCEEPNYAW